MWKGIRNGTKDLPNLRRSFVLLLISFSKSLVNMAAHYNLPRGGDEQIMLPLAPKGSLEPLLPDSTGSKKLPWSAEDVIDWRFVQSPSRFLWVFLYPNIFMMWEMFHLACQVSIPLYSLYKVIYQLYNIKNRFNSHLTGIQKNLLLLECFSIR